ncbi:MAG: 50S ribosomal protein L13 [Deltaproteobacteria bacterium]|nr:50S ribosomal protein L13 [Deltaproteobacteria bacterium]
MTLQKSYTQKKSEIQHDWFVADATDQVLGRFASKIAHVLRGKHKPTYTPHMDGGDFVVVTNAEKVKFTGNKLNAKKYYNFTGFRGGLKEQTAKQMIQETPEDVLTLAVRGMLPKGPLGRQMLSKLKVYAGNEHPHTAQQPKELV